ncbi:MAG: hypothetical protein GC150_17645 [Rhizobiales bacterium]|nr:hypothetical protein [Hyphomicrobiales bacterium]
MRRHLTALAAAALLAMSHTGTRAASLDIDVDIELPQILILYCYTDVDIDITAADMGALLNTGLTFAADGTGVSATASLTGTPTIAVNGTSITATLNANTSTTPNPVLTSKSLALNNVCAMRGLATGTVSVSAAGLTSFDNGASSITVGAWAAGGPYTVALGGTPTPINLTTTANLSALSAAGVHQGDDVLTVTATLP